MIIRNEKPSDIEAISQVTQIAFKHHSFRQQTEHFIIRDLRSAGALTLSLVVEVQGQIVGHIAFSPVTISDGTLNWYCLGPVSVLPDYQGCRIGTALINNGLDILTSEGGNGFAIVGMPAFHQRFGFRNYPQLVHKGVPQEVFVVKSIAGQVPTGTVEFHQAFKQLSAIEKEAVADVIVDYDIGGIRVDAENPAIERLLEKEILTKTSNGKCMIRPSALAEYDEYFGKVAQFRTTEISRVHKNPIMRAITHGR